MHLTGFLIRSTVVAALGGLLFGFDTAVIAGVTDALTRTYQLDPNGLRFTVADALAASSEQCWLVIRATASGGVTACAFWPCFTLPLPSDALLPGTGMRCSSF